MANSMDIPTTHPQEGPVVTIMVNDHTIEIHRGHQLVSAIKSDAGVPQADVLAALVDGRLVDLPNDGAMIIKGGERFVSYPPTGTSA